jgi:hypothetical protein
VEEASAAPPPPLPPTDDPDDDEMRGTRDPFGDPLLIVRQYRQLKETPIEKRVVALRSPIHGWGLFALQEFGVNGACGMLLQGKYSVCHRDVHPLCLRADMIVEYCGQVIRRSVGDMREAEWVSCVGVRWWSSLS